MKKLLKLTLVVVLVMSSTSLFAQKFGRINSQEIIANMAETKEAQTQLEAFATELQAQMESIQVEFNTKFQEYQKGAATMSDSVKQIKEKELTEIQTRLRDFEQMAQQDIQKKQMELFQPIQEKAVNAINEVAKAGGYVFVYDVISGSMAYVDEATVTDLGPAVRTKLGITETPAAAK
jgi:outer membrane protein